MARDMNYPEQINFLTLEGTIAKLRALSFLRGKRGSYGSAARDAMELGIGKILEGLSPAERKAYDEILKNIKLQQRLAREIREQDQESG